MERKEEMKFGGAAMSLPVDLSCLQGGGGGGGGAEGEAALAALEKQLICPICLELFNKPVVILPCEHNLCRKCANELYQPSLFQARTTMLVNSGRFRCPSCRHEVVLDRHGVYGLQRNLLVENIIDVYKQEVSNNNNKETSPLPPPPAAQVTCPDHEGEKVNIYCLTCQVPTCSLCKVFGAHQSHQVAPLTDVYQQQKDELSKEVTSLVAFNDKVQSLINELEETCRNIEENCKTQKQSVCDRFSHVFSILEEKQKAMTQRISSEQEEKTGHAKALVRCYGDSVAANSKLMERAASSMEEPDMAAFVQNSRELITKVLAATGSCPAETLKPGYESMSHYRYNFSRQERALRSLDFPKVVEDVPEEPEVEQEPEEPKEPSVQSTEPKHHPDNTTQNQESALEPVKEPVPALISPPAAPTSAPAPAAPAAPPAPGLVMDSVQPAGADLQPETDDLQINDGGSGQMKNKKEEEEKAEEDRCAAPEPVKEGNICEHQEGMSTQQCEGAEAGSEAGDWTTQSESEDKQDAQDEEEEEEEEEKMNEGNDTTFYPSWYKPNSWCSPVPADIQLKVQDTEQTICSSRPAEDHLVEASIQTEARGGLQSPCSQSQPQPLKAPAVTPVPQLRLTQQEAAGEDGEEEEDMQGWVCLPGAADRSFHAGDSFAANNDRPSSKPPEETCSGPEGGRSETDEDNLKLSGGRLQGAEETERHDEDDLNLKCVSELKERESGEFEVEMLNESLETGSEEEAESTREDRSEAKRVLVEAEDDDDDVESLRDGDSEFEASGLAEKKEEDGESSDKTAESEEKISSSDSLQAVTLLFYLLAFLVILQRVWAYIGCFICT